MIFQTDQTEPSLMFGGGPSWLPQNTRRDPFAQPNRQSGFRGLLGNQDLALALLANSGYSPQKRSFGEILGTSMLQANQMKTGREDEAFKRKYMEAQMGAMQAKPTGPSSVQEYEYAKKNGFAGSFQDWIVAGGQSSRPSAVQEWEHFNSLSPEDQDRYLLMKRSQMQKVEELAGGKSVVSATPLGKVSTTPLTSLSSEAEAAGTISSARKSGEVSGGAKAQAAVDLPMAEAGAKYTTDLVRAIKEHPGKKFAVGAASVLPTVPGTKQADFVARWDQLKGKQFLEAYQSLKGGGQITEVEGAKAEAAIARMQRAQTVEAFDEAADEFISVVDIALNNARKKAGAEKPAAKKRTYNPTTGKIE